MSWLHKVGTSISVMWGNCRYNILISLKSVQGITISVSRDLSVAHPSHICSNSLLINIPSMMMPIKSPQAKKS